MTMKKGSGIALVLALSVLGATGCGVIYEPQEFSKSNLTYGYKGDFEAAIELVPLTFRAARVANADGYRPRSLPTVFDGIEPFPNISTRDRLAEAGLDRIVPPLRFDPPPNYVPYDRDREVNQPGLRDDRLPPLPGYDLSSNPLDTRGLDRSGTVIGGGGGSLEPVTPLDQLTVRRRANSRPLPNVSPPRYTIGPGDVLSLQSRARVLPSLRASEELDGGDSGGVLRLLVQDNGEVFIPEVGSVFVSGLTLSTARQRIADELAASQIGFGTGVEIVEFGSKRVAVSGLSGNQLIPITVRPTTLGEAITLSGGLGPNPENTIVRVLREGEIYEVPGIEAAGSSAMIDRVLLDGDIVSIVPAYDVELALNYFDQQLRLRELERGALADALSNRAEAREVEAIEREKLRLQIELENYRLASERLRQQAQIERLASQRETNRLNEEARIGNIEARQTYLDRLRDLEELNREALRQFRSETREILTLNQAERSRERADLRELLELELREERLRLEQRGTERQQARALFAERIRFGAEQQDYVTIAGETRSQTIVPLPFESSMTLNRVIYENNNGINLLTGDTSEIYVFRVPRERGLEDRLLAYHLDASNPAALAVASVFEMRPNDVVYVNPQPITKWNRVLTQILPSTGLLQSGLTAATTGQ